jgi:hypothetical protein
LLRLQPAGDRIKHKQDGVTAALATCDANQAPDSLRLSASAGWPTGIKHKQLQGAMPLMSAGPHPAQTNR